MNQLKVFEHDGQRVLTTTLLAESYDSTADKISYNFNYNESRYKEGKHYFLLTGESLKEFKSAYREFQGSVNRLYLWTEKGAWLHAKSLNTDRAWEAYEMLVDDYYRVKTSTIDLTGLSPQLQIIIRMEQGIKTLESRQEVTESRMEKIENNTTIDYGQQQSLKKEGGKVVIKALGGKDSSAYRNNSLRGKVYSALWGDFKDYFNVNSMNNTLIKDYDRAIQYAKDWKLQGGLLREVEEMNTQLVF